MDDVAPPEVRQCRDPQSPQFGWVALRVDVQAGAWFIGKRSGGYYGGDATVEGWEVFP